MAEVDGEFLLSLARDKSGKRRQLLAETISDLFTGKNRVLSERERTLMFDILQKMPHNTEMDVRRIIAEQLSELPDAPHDLITLLANDDIQVAFSILHDSAVLEDEDLIEVIRHRAQEYHLAIAARNKVSQDVSGALVETGDESVITTLLNNSSSVTSQTTLEFLVEESKRVDAYQKPILHRDDLDPDLAKRMYLWVTAALRKFILENFELDKTVLDDILENSADAVPKDTSTKSDELAKEVESEGLGLAKMMIRDIGIGGTAGGRRMTGEINIVLDGERNTVKRQILVSALLQFLGAGKNGLLGKQVDPHIVIAYGGDAGENSVGDITGTHRPGPVSPGQGWNCQTIIWCQHGCPQAAELRWKLRIINITPRIDDDKFAVASGS